MNAFPLILRRASGPLALAVLLLAGSFPIGCGGKEGNVTGPRKEVTGVDTLGIVPVDSSRPVDTLTVATLNMSIGFPVSQLFFLDMDDETVAYNALVDMMGRYLKGHPTERVKAMGKVIAGLDLDVVGLQEVMAIKRGDTLVNDFLAELLVAIKANGGPDYHVLHTPMNDTLMQGRKGDSTIRLDFVEGQALLVKSTFAVLDSARFPYFSLLPIPVEGAPKTERGADYLRVKSPAGTEFQVFNTHLEVFNSYSNSQASELTRLADSLQIRKDGRGRLQLILGDFNAEPDKDGHRLIKRRGFVDTFDGVSQDSGGTCCVAGSALWNPDTAFSNRRIDYVMARGLAGRLLSRTDVKGAYTGEGGVRFLASDHRMVMARIAAQ